MTKDHPHRQGRLTRSYKCPWCEPKGKEGIVHYLRTSPDGARVYKCYRCSHTMHDRKHLEEPRDFHAENLTERKREV